MAKRLISDENLISFLKAIKLISDSSTGDVSNQLDRVNRLKERINNLINRIKNISITDFNGIGEAPADDNHYARSNKQWVKVDVSSKPVTPPVELPPNKTYATFEVVDGEWGKWAKIDCYILTEEYYLDETGNQRSRVYKEKLYYHDPPGCLALQTGDDDLDKKYSITDEIKDEYDYYFTLTNLDEDNEYVDGYNISWYMAYEHEGQRYNLSGEPVDYDFYSYMWMPLNHYGEEPKDPEYEKPIWINEVENWNSIFNPEGETRDIKLKVSVNGNVLPCTIPNIPYYNPEPGMTTFTYKVLRPQFTSISGDWGHADENTFTVDPNNTGEERHGFAAWTLQIFENGSPSETLNGTSSNLVIQKPIIKPTENTRNREYAFNGNGQLMYITGRDRVEFSEALRLYRNIEREYDDGKWYTESEQLEIDHCEFSPEEGVEVVREELLNSNGDNRYSLSLWREGIETQSMKMGVATFYFYDKEYEGESLQSKELIIWSPKPIS